MTVYGVIVFTPSPCEGWKPLSKILGETLNFRYDIILSANINLGLCALEQEMLGTQPVGSRRSTKQTLKLLPLQSGEETKAEN